MYNHSRERYEAVAHCESKRAVSVWRAFRWSTSSTMNFIIKSALLSDCMGSHRAIRSAQMMNPIAHCHARVLFRPHDEPHCFMSVAVRMASFVMALIRCERSRPRDAPRPRRCTSARAPVWVAGAAGRAARRPAHFLRGAQAVAHSCSIIR